MRSSNDEIFYQRLRTLRERRGLSVRAVAETIGVPMSTYREWENGRAVQGTRSYAPLAQVLQVSIHELLTGEAPQEQAKHIAYLNAAIQELENLRRVLLS
ncbi:MAG: helix-turn-helix transcriptional regulator [Oligoflexia bacterium]|nr:helix-turn-helix transcriptional regulator [Oligoflexia bacterium]